MTDATLSYRVSRFGQFVPRLGFLLALLALVMLALAPLGWRLGWWPYATSFWYLMEPAAFIAIGGGVISLIALLWWGGMSGGERVMALAGIVIGAAVFYVPWQFYHTVGQVPRIHDITTDTENPPAFSAAVMAARQAEHGDVRPYSQDVGRQQQAGYPDLAPLKTTVPPADAFKRALAVVQAMPRTTVDDSDPAKGTIEASQRSLFMGFTDDFVLRVTPDGQGSRIDMRSESRQGRSDLGVNAKRIRSTFAALKGQLG